MQVTSISIEYGGIIGIAQHYDRPIRKEPTVTENQQLYVTAQANK